MSRNLTTRQAESMVAAAEFAVRVQLPFQRHWTVHYERAGVEDREGAVFVTRLLKLVGKAARRAGGGMAALWVRENGEGKGAHVHILMHLPGGMTLRGRTRRWIVAAGGAYRARVSKVRTIGQSLASADSGSAQYRANADAVQAYQLKAASADVGATVVLARSGEGGPIIGKRCGMTQNLGTKARSTMRA